MNTIRKHQFVAKTFNVFVFICLVATSLGPVHSVQALQATLGTFNEMPVEGVITTETVSPTEPPPGTPLFNPTVDLNKAAGEITLDFTQAGVGTLFRAHVLLKNPSDLARLQGWGIEILTHDDTAAFVQVNKKDLEKLARLGFEPSQIDSINYLLTIYTALMGEGYADGSTSVSGPEFLMSLSDVDSDSDGLTDTEESWWCTDPQDNNSDFSGVPTLTDPNDGDEVSAILKGIKAYGPPFEMWPNFKPYHASGTCQDGDFDGAPDNAELYMLGTSPLRESSDLDKFDDGQELFGVTFCPAASGPCGYGILPRAEDAAFVSANLPAWVKAPGDSPFVAAFPQPEVEVVPSSINMTAATIITTTRTITEGEEHTYGTASTTGSSTSLAETETWNNWQSVAKTTRTNLSNLSFFSPISNSESQASDYKQRWNATKIGIAIGLGAIGICAAITVGICGVALSPIAGAIIAGGGAAMTALGDYYVDKFDTGISIPENEGYLDLNSLYPEGIQIQVPTNECLEFGSFPGSPSCKEFSNGLRLAGEFDTLQFNGETTSPLEDRQLGSGTQYGIGETNNLTIQRIYHTSFPVANFVPTTTVTQGSEQGGARTTTTTEYEEHTISEASTNQFSESWASATAIDSSHSADLRFTYRIINKGTEYTREITNLTFNIFIGNNPNPTITYIAVGPTGQIAKIENLFPGDELVYTSNLISLTLDEMQSIDEGAPIRIVLEDISFG
ncbi:MAG: hypothetical protein ABIJ65_12930, partial [Chloroflexota bacterium]